MKYSLNLEQEKKFEALLEIYKDKVSLALYKTNITKENYDYFYSFAVEGFLQAFLILDAGAIEEKDFSAFVFTSMKRKIIDELRRLNRNKDIAINIEENYKTLSYKEDRIEAFIIRESLKSKLNDREMKICMKHIDGYSYKEIIKQEKISKSTYYSILASIRDKCSDLLYK